jgi:polar amino acid transport system substrate-binding protein
MKDPKSGEVRGAALDLGRALAAKIGAKFEQVLYPGPGAVLKGIQNNEWDVTFLVVAPGLSALADSSLPYMQSDFTYLVPAGSKMHSASELDQTGIRIAVPSRHGSDLRLTKMLKHAELVRVATIAAAIDLVREGKVDAYASTRPALMALSRKVPGSQVLKNGFADISWAAIVPKGNAGRIAYLNDFLKEAKTSGLVQQTIDGNGLKGIKVTP